MMGIKTLSVVLLFCLTASEMKAQDTGIETGFAIGPAWTFHSDLLKGGIINFNLDRAISNAARIGAQINWAKDLENLIGSCQSIAPRGCENDEVSAFALISYFKLRHPTPSKELLLPYIKIGIGYIRMHNPGPGTSITPHIFPNPPPKYHQSDSQNRIGIIFAVGFDFNNTKNTAMFLESGILTGPGKHENLQLLNIKLGVRIK